MINRIRLIIEKLQIVIIRLFLILTAVLLSATVCSAESKDFLPWQSNMFIGIGTTSEGIPTQQGGLGGERFIHKGFGLGGEFGYSSPLFTRDKSYMWLSGNSSYHFFRSESEWTPFITGGYTFRFGDQKASMFNFGAGVTQRISGARDIRIELRDQVLFSPQPVHFLQFRIGMVFDCCHIPGVPW